MIWLVALVVGIVSLVMVERWMYRKDGPNLGPVSRWFHVKWDDQHIHLDVRSRKPWQAEIPWSEIERVALKMEPGDFMGVSNGLYVWVRGREHSYVIPLDATGGWDLLQELPKRDKFSGKLLIEAMGSHDGVFVWPRE